MTAHPKSMTTAERAIEAAKKAESEGFRVRDIVISGKAFTLRLQDDNRDDYDLRDMTL